jgi:hypothetical protein
MDLLLERQAGRDRRTNGGVRMTYVDRKISERCVEKGCPRAALEDNGRGRACRDKHRARNRRWKQGWLQRSRGGNLVAV